MNINKIIHDYRLFVNDLFNRSKDEVYTTREVYDLYSKEYSDVSFDVMRAYISHNFPRFKVGNTFYYGSPRVVNKLRKILNNKEALIEDKKTKAKN